MASPDEPFSNAVVKFEATLTPKQLQDFKQNCTLQHVEQTIRDLQTSQSAKRNQRNMHRISKFVEGMNQLGQVVEIFLNVHATVAFIWGPIKFLLVTANTLINTLDCLLDTYSEIGDILPSLTQYTKLLDKHPNIRVHLENYYCDVLEFHRKALDVFARPSWKLAFHSSWKTFRSQFNETLTKLKRHRDLLSDEKITAAIFEVRDIAQSVQSVEDKLDEMSRQLQQLHISVDDKATVQHKQHLEEKRKYVFSKLDAPEYDVDLEMAFKERKGGSYGDWILADHTYREWVELTGTDDKRWLYLNGIPGTGKTVLASRIVEHLQSIRSADNRVKVVFFFFKHKYVAKRTPTALLLSILSQLAVQDEVTLDLLYQQLAALDGQMLKSASVLQELASVALASQPSCFIVVDGLDECVAGLPDGPEESQNEVLQWMETVCPTASNQRLRILVSGQRNGFLEQRLRHHPSIQLEVTDGHTADIKVYADVRTRDIQQKFKIQEAQRLDIVDRVSSGAKGMFLYAKIVLGNLLSQSSRGLFKRELNEENFPKGLDQAYERVVVHVLENSNESEREAASRILGHVICSIRPLLWKEIQAFFCIDVDAEVADPDYQLLESAKHYCGSLIDTTQPQGSLLSSEDTVEIVHETARGYLLHTSRFNLATLHAQMALFCAKYLNSTPFTLGEDDPRVAEHCKTGYYAGIDYAASSWWKHGAYLRKMESRDEELNQALQEVNQLSRTLRNTKTGTKSPEIHVDDFFSEDAREWEERFPVEHLISPFRKCIEEIAHTGGFESQDLDDPSDPALLYGKTSFKCSKPWCGYFRDGFGTADERDEHVDQHNRPYRCKFDGCPGQMIGFAKDVELAAHNDRLHQGGSDDNECFPMLSKKKVDIFYAIRNGDLGLLQEIISLDGTIINLTDSRKGHPLFVAAQSRRYHVCKYLLENGAQVNAQPKRSGQTALCAAVANRDPDIVRLLIAFGASGYLRDRFGKNLVGEVLEAGDAIRSAFPQDFLLHQHCSRIRCQIYPLDDQSLDGIMSNDNLERFKLASGRSCSDVLRRWNESHCPTPFALYQHPLNEAIRQKANSIAEYILHSDRFGVSYLWQFGHFYNPTPLIYACHGSLNQQMFDRLLPLVTSHPDMSLTARSDIINQAFKVLVEKKSVDGQLNRIKLAMIGRLIGSGMVLFNEPDPKDGRIPLHHACEMTQDWAVIETIITNTTNANLKDKRADTPFALAIRKGNFIACKVLLDRGVIDLSQTSAEEAIVACTMPSRTTEFPDWLISRIKDQDGGSNGPLYPLHTAAFFLNLEAITLLLKLTDESANVPMHKIPPQWHTFFGVLHEADLELPATPLFIAMNRICGKQKPLRATSGFRLEEERVLACRAEFKPIFDAFCQSRSLDLSERSNHLTHLSKVAELMLISACCDDEVTARIANAGFKLPWDLLRIGFGEVQGMGPRRSPEILLGRGSFAESECINVSHIVRAFIDTGTCKLADIITENFDLAIALINNDIIKPDQVSMTQRESMWSIIEQSKDVNALNRLIKFGLDKGTMLLGAARNGMLGLVALLSLTGLFEEYEIAIAYDHARFVQQDREKESEKA